MLEWETARDKQRKKELAPERWGFMAFKLVWLQYSAQGYPWLFFCVQVTMSFLCLQLLVVDKLTGNLLEGKTRSKQSSR